VSGYLPNEEIDDVRWVEVAEAADLLSYGHDRATLAEALPHRRGPPAEAAALYTPLETQAAKPVDASQAGA